MDRAGRLERVNTLATYLAVLMAATALASLYYFIADDATFGVALGAIGGAFGLAFALQARRLVSPRAKDVSDLSLLRLIALGTLALSIVVSVIEDDALDAVEAIGVLVTAVAAYLMIQIMADLRGAVAASPAGMAQPKA